MVPAAKDDHKLNLLEEVGQIIFRGSTSLLESVDHILDWLPTKTRELIYSTIYS